MTDAPTTITYFTKPQLLEAIDTADAWGLNRVMPRFVVEEASDDTYFPVLMTLPHEHAQGKLVPVERMHIRCCIVTDSNGQRYWQDVPMSIYAAAGTYERMPLED